MNAPKSNKNKKVHVLNHPTSVPKIVFGGYIRFFQKFISPVDGPRCQMYPTCSQYGREAVKKHGALLGFIMSADRLMRDNGGVPQHYPLIIKFNRFFYFDPVSANDLWLLEYETKPKNR